MDGVRVAAQRPAIDVTPVTTSYDVIVLLSIVRSLLQLPPFKFTMSVLDKFRKGAAKAGIQATAFIKEGSSRVQSSSQSFAQGFSLPGEAEKAAKILASFLGLSPTRMHPETHY